MTLKSRIRQLEAKVKAQLSPTVVIAMGGVLSPKGALLIEQARTEGREILRVNIVSVVGNK